jgi:hypothetical protein
MKELRFLDTFYSSASTLVRNAEIYPKVYADFRRILLKPFPYKTYFRTADHAVVIALLIQRRARPKCRPGDSE